MTCHSGWSTSRMPKKSASLFEAILTIAASGHLEDFGWTANAGVDLARKEALGDVEVGSALLAGIGASYDLTPELIMGAELTSHIGFAGYLGKRYDPFIAQHAARLPVYTNVGVDTGNISGGDIFNLPSGLSSDRVQERDSLATQVDRLRSEIDSSGSMEVLDTYQRQAIEMVAARNAPRAFDVSLEPPAVREKYGKHLWCQQALLARRLVAAGASFVTIDLSYHSASRT